MADVCFLKTDVVISQPSIAKPDIILSGRGAILIKRYDVQIEAILFPVSHLLISLPSEGQSL